MTYFFEKNPVCFGFLTLPLEFPNKTKFDPWKIHKIVLNPLQILDDIFLITPESFTSLLINPWKSACYFFNTHGNSVS